MTDDRDGGAVVYFGVAYGWGADLIEKQLEAFGIQMAGDVLKQIPKWQKLADSILMLTLHSYMRDSEAKRIRNKLALDMEKWLVDKEYLVPVKAQP